MIDFNKGNGLVPAIVQHAYTQKVLMLGYMNQEALQQTLDSGKVTFYSRSKKRLWTKGESSGNLLHFQSYAIDCDRDTLLVQALPQGATCHLGSDTCFGPSNAQGFLYQLQGVIDSRITTASEGSYTKSLFEQGLNKMAQKVGEEAVETVIEATNGSEDLLKEECADLLFHLLLLLRAKGLSLQKIEGILKERHLQKS